MGASRSFRDDPRIVLHSFLSAPQISPGSRREAVRAITPDDWSICPFLRSTLITSFKCLTSHGSVRSSRWSSFFPYDRAHTVWQTATRLHFNRDFRLNSQSLAACLTPTSALGGRAWPNFLMTDRRDETATVLWANTTLGLMLFWWFGTTQQAGRSNLTISRLPNLPALDSRAMSDAQHACAQGIFEDFRARPFLPANEAAGLRRGDGRDAARFRRREPRRRPPHGPSRRPCAGRCQEDGRSRPVARRCMARTVSMVSASAGVLSSR